MMNIANDENHCKEPPWTWVLSLYTLSWYHPSILPLHIPVPLLHTNIAQYKWLNAIAGKGNHRQNANTSRPKREAAQQVRHEACILRRKCDWCLAGTQYLETELPTNTTHSNNSAWPWPTRRTLPAYCGCAVLSSFGRYIVIRLFLPLASVPTTQVCWAQGLGNHTLCRLYTEDIRGGHQRARCSDARKFSWCLKQWWSPCTWFANHSIKHCISFATPRWIWPSFTKLNENCWFRQELWLGSRSTTLLCNGWVEIRHGTRSRSSQLSMSWHQRPRNKGPPHLLLHHATSRTKLRATFSALCANDARPNTIIIMTSIIYCITYFIQRKPLKFYIKFID